MRKVTEVGTVAKEYIGRYPEMPTRTLAKLMRKERPLIYKSAEAARHIIRLYKGTMGDKMRKQVADKRFMVIKSDNPFGLPESQAEAYPPYILPDSIKKIGIMSDVHVPYHDTKALTLAIKHLKAEKIDCLVLNGDIADCYSLSRWEKNPEKRDFPKEREAVVLFLRAIRKAFPNILIVYKEGNHEMRFGATLIGKAPDFFGMSEFRLPVIFDLFNLGIDWVDDKKVIQYRELDILHGHELLSVFGGVNPARTTLLRCRTNVMVSHYHKKTNDMQRTLRDEYLQAWSIGCLSELRPRFMPINDWQHGFAIIHGGDGWSVENRTIIKDKIV